MTITIVRSFAVDPPTEVICTDGEWTVSSDQLHISSSGKTVGEAMDGYVKAWSAWVNERLASQILDVIGARR